MEWRNLPPLNSLRAFSALAETGGYTKAGMQLNVTQAAVSQQVKSLEAWLGVQLVNKTGRTVTLTAEGAILAKGLETGFRTFQESIKALSEANAARPVQVTMSPAFAAEWMLARISEFQDLHPDIMLMLNPTIEVIDLASSNIDLAIRFRDRRSLVQEGMPFLVFDAVIIGVPGLLKGRDLNDPKTLLSLPWLEELGRNDVADWFDRHGVHTDQLPPITRMPGNLVTQAVRRGDGITHTLKDYFLEEIDTGKLVTAFNEKDFGRFSIVKPDGPMRPAALTFLDWLKSKATTIT